MGRALSLSDFVCHRTANTILVPADDFLREGWRSLVFSWNFIRRKPGTHAGKKTRRKQLLAEQKADKHVDNQPQYGLDFGAAFAGVDDSDGSPALSDDLSHFSTHEPKGSSVLPMTAFGRLPGTERRRSFSGDNYDPTYAPGDVGAHRSYDMEELPSPVPIRETSRPPSRMGHTAVEIGERK